MSDPAPTLDVRCFRSALDLCNHLKQEQLPVWIKCGDSSFRITKENFDTVALGVLMAASWTEGEEE